MRLQELLDKKNMSVLRCSQESRIPYSTLSDIVKGKTSIEKTAADVIYKLSKTLNISMEELMDTTTGYKKKRTNGVTVIIEVHSPRGVGTIIFADYKTQTVHIENKTTRILDTAFGKNTEPTWKQYEEFLNERCFPQTRDRLKLVLKDVGVDSYDALQIIRKTKGRMNDDHLWLELYWNEEAFR